MSKILVTGSGAGLGAALVTVLRGQGHDVVEYDIKHGHDVRDPVVLLEDLDILINCAGINRINWLKDVSEHEWDAVMDTNVKGIFLMAQECRYLLSKSHGTILNIVSNAAHMPMRCSAAYNASKGAALILTKQLARELASDGITVFSVSPNKLHGTEMSDSIDEQVVATRGWTKEQAQAYQMQSLLAGAETPVIEVAEFIAYLLSRKERHRYLTGCDLQYGA